MATQPVHRLTPEEYLAIEEQADHKSEYYNGEMFAMAGASRNHIRLAVRLTRLVDQQLDGMPCSAWTSDARVYVPATKLYTYPDLTVVCGAERFERNNLLNPAVIFEILSPTTEGYDRGRKFDHYRTIESLAQYVTIAQDSVQVLVYTRTPEGNWLLTSATDRKATIELASAGCVIPVGQLYENVQFDEEAVG